MEIYFEQMLKLAEERHAGQFRFDKVTPYFTHIQAVVDRVPTFALKAVAAGHDLLEDTETTEAELREHFPANVVDAIVLLTKPRRLPKRLALWYVELSPEKSYEDYLARVKDNPLARKVKIADMLANLSDTPTKNQIKKYAKGLLYLLD